MLRSAKNAFAWVVTRGYRIRAIKAFFVSAILYLFTFQYCRNRYWRDPHSAFFDISHVYEWKYSLIREHEANHYVSFQENNDDLKPGKIVKSGDNPLICAAFVTVKRDVDNYFEESIGSMLERLDPRERRALYLKVLFANTDPTRHPNWAQRWMDRLVDSAETYNVSESTFQYLQKLEVDRDFRTKGVFDYIYVLNSCLASNAPYIGIFEDDVIFADGWMAQTLKALLQLNPTLPEQSFAELAREPSPWLYIRLFYTETSLMWENSDFVYRNMLTVFLTVIALSFLFLYTARRSAPKLQLWLDYGTIGVLCLVTVPAFTGLYYMIGKYSMHPLQGLVPMDEHGCCTQGLIFARQNVPKLIEYLDERKSGQTDAMIEEFAAKENLQRYALAPPQLQHIGLRSSRDNLEINTQSTWAFWFEDNNPQQLRAEHNSLLIDKKVQRLLRLYEREA